MAGVLYLVPTPIGNLGDVTVRCLDVLREVDLVACEDTRHAATLLRHYEIRTPRQSYHQHNEAARTKQFLRQLEQGSNLALVSNAGTPLISDPGFRLVRACIDAGIAVVPLPGPVAATTALSASGLPTESFLFVGFLPLRKAIRQQRLSTLARLDTTLIIYEAPHRILFTLRDMIPVFGSREVCLARELTKVHEEWIRGTLPQALDALETRDRIRGEFTLVVGPAGATPPHVVDYPKSIREHVDREMGRTGSDRNQALKRVANQRGISRKEAYRLLVEESSLE